MEKSYFQRKVTAGVVLSALLTVLTSAGALWTHTEKVHVWSHQSAATVGESMSVVYGMTAFFIPNDDLQGEEPARVQLSVREVERVTGLDFNPDLSPSEVDRLEANGGAWVFAQRSRCF